MDVLLGPEMRSTGEVMGLDKTYDMAFAKSQLGAGMRIPQAGTVFVSVKDADKPRILPAMRKLVELGFKHRAPPAAPSAIFEEQGHSLDQDQQGARRPPACGGRHQERRHPARAQHHRDRARRSRIRSRSARPPLLQKVPYYTTLPGILAVTKAIAAQKAGTIEVRPLQDYF